VGAYRLRQQGDLLCLLFFFSNKKIGLKKFLKEPVKTSDFAVCFEIVKACRLVEV
jgi:hypothetical protein